jgi:hypothetical protein
VTSFLAAGKSARSGRECRRAPQEKITQASRDIRDQRHDDAVTWADVTP